LEAVGRGLLFLLGLVWPFLMAGLGIFVVSTGVRLSDGPAIALFAASFLAFVAMFVGLIGPTEPPPRVARVILAGAVSAGLVLIEVALAVIVFIHGTNATGYGWIE
jgi:hypothetical protein